MKKIAFMALFALASLSFAQIGVSSSAGADSKWRLGGGMGLGFGDNSHFNLNISPYVGYEIAPEFEMGMTAGYQYSSWKDVKQNLFSVGPFANYYPLPELFLRAHYEYFTGNTKFKNLGESSTHTYDEDALWLGGGYRSTGRVSFFTGVMYNVLYKKDDSIFSSGFRPYVGVGFVL